MFSNKKVKNQQTLLAVSMISIIIFSAIIGLIIQSSIDTKQKEKNKKEQYPGVEIKLDFQKNTSQEIKESLSFEKENLIDNSNVNFEFTKTSELLQKEEQSNRKNNYTVFQVISIIAIIVITLIVILTYRKIKIEEE